MHVAEEQAGSPRRTASSRRSAVKRTGSVEQALAVDEQQRATVDADVALVLEVRHEIVEDGQVTDTIVVLGHEHVLLAAVPATRPRLVGPAEAEREVRLPVARASARVAAPAAVGRRTSRSSSRSRRCHAPVRAPPGADGHRGRGGRSSRAQPGSWGPRGRDTAGGRLDLCPVGEALAPPLVVLRDAVILGQVEGDHRGCSRDRPGARG